MSTKQIQYFKEGEEVVLLSKSVPLQHGDTEILLATLNVKLFTCPHCGSLLRNSMNTNAYYLSIYVKGDCCTPWHQDALRKKHKRSTRSFESLMKYPSSY